MVVADVHSRTCTILLPICILLVVVLHQVTIVLAGSGVERSGTPESTTGTETESEAVREYLESHVHVFNDQQVVTNKIGTTPKVQNFYFYLKSCTH